MATISEHMEACFGIEKLHPHQFETLSALLKKRDVLLACQTGGGKSLCYHFIRASLSRTTTGSDAITVVVVSPLISIMVEQVTVLNSLGFTATYIGMDNADEKCLMDGVFQFVFGSPESIVGNVKCEKFGGRVYDDDLGQMAKAVCCTVEAQRDTHNQDSHMYSSTRIPSSNLTGCTHANRWHLFFFGGGILLLCTQYISHILTGWIFNLTARSYEKHSMDINPKDFAIKLHNHIIFSII